MEIHGTQDITPAMMRDGYEALEVGEERLAELGLPGFTVPVDVSCENHGGPGLGMIQQWDADAQSWELITDFISADRDVVDPLIMEDSMAYAQEAGIEPRACD
jgi:hypothetical protein